jgi:predicted transcriptional regulator
MMRLCKKGYVLRSELVGGIVYRAAIESVAAQKSVLSEVVRVFFAGSSCLAVTVLLGMSDGFSDCELSEIEATVAKLRKLE